MGAVFDPQGCFDGLLVSLVVTSMPRLQQDDLCSFHLSAVLILGLTSIVIYGPWGFFFLFRDKAAVEQCHHSGCVRLALHRLLVCNAPHRLGRVRLRAPQDLLHSGLQQGRQVGTSISRPHDAAE